MVFGEVGVLVALSLRLGTGSAGGVMGVVFVRLVSGRVEVLDVWRAHSQAAV